MTPSGIDDLVVLLDEDDVDVVDIGVDRDVILGEVVVHEAAEARDRARLLLQRHADAPDDAAEDLAARGLRVEDPARRRPR